ncbi:hypothetical protein GCM10023188_36970 [Pontibacter saemangeumensis]|uniref:Glycosyl transferase family 1 domain-containing protein n=1 Tax=Pontibacter saemangeumensis TaxID=1084525 RepID=A0ABP8LY37_9BACT
MRVLFIQPDCRQYRVKLFEELSRSLKGTELLHFGPRKFSESKELQEINASKFNFRKFHWVSGLYKIVKNYDTVVVGFDPHWLNIFFLSVFFRKKIIYWGHGTSKTQYLNSLRRFVGRRARAIVTYDENGKADIIKLGIDPDRVFVANNTQFVSNSENLSSETKDCFVFVGRIQPRKRIEDFIAAFALVRHKLPKQLRIVIIGDGDHRSVLKSIAIKLGVENYVEFVVGTTEEEDLKTYFSKAYAYVSPGHVGLGVLHSFAYGVPVITYKGDHHAPEYSNILQAVTGILVRPNVPDLAEALVSVVKDENYKMLGHNAYVHYQENRKISQMVNAFQNAINTG